METPTLTEMGITSIDEISDFSVQTNGPKSDFLTIFYKRKSLTLRPVRRIYEFGRASRSVIIDSGSGTTEEIHDPSPILEAAVKELRQLLGGVEAGPDPKEALYGQLADLQNAVKQGADAAQIDQRLHDLKHLIEKL